MMTAQNIEFWKNQSLVIETDEEDVYNSRIVKIEDGLIYVAYPVNEQGVSLEQIDGRQVHVYFYDDLNNQYVFMAEMLLSEGRACFAKPQLEAIRKVQRRGYFRVPASLEMWLEIEDEEKVMCITDDISGGGVSFFSTYADQLEVNDEIKGGLYLDGQSSGGEVQFSARVISIRKELNKLPRISVAFIEMKEAYKIKIMRYCIKRQIEVHKTMRELQKVTK